ncbi:laccase-like multicopper oxidase [Cenococcum geophilum 1.58]|uniref:laccase-like multicopper oxidase n=1 Tax=Cenococcum geophilum 1.58 TaxID=794803 RepID=UPI00358F4621|nr:laccase-like multicopper oxidase [Cenococcum geophilum 1.58]
MVAAAPYVTSAVTLTSVVHYASSYLPVAYNTTRTSVITKTVTVCPCTDSLATLASATYNPNGPYVNPYDYSSLPFSWPGKPTHGETTPAPLPTAPFPYGGKASGKYEAPAWIPKGYHSLVPGIPQNGTNGNSQWGDLHCPHLPVDGLPPYGPSSSISGSASASVIGSHSGSPSGIPSISISGIPSISISESISASASTSPSSPCGEMPDTGVTRTYDFHVAYQTIAPDGVQKNGITINGGFPGPLIEANWGDWIMVNVTNDLPNEGTTLHWHGFRQQGTPWYDGVPAVTQCPIIPGNTLSYLFRADLFGTSWYHSHYSAQYAGGAVGPMVIHGPKTADYDIDIGPVMVSDWYHQDYFTLVNQTMQGNFPPSNNNLINGKMNYPCENTTLPCTPNAGISKFQFTSGKKHLVRIVNTGAEGTQKFSIDNHTLTVIANDFIPVVPYTTNVVTVGIGQRTDVIVEGLSNSAGVYWMRSQLGTDRCTLNDGVSPNAVAAVYYEDADTSSVPETTSDVTAVELAKCSNDALNQTVPFCPLKIDSNPASVETIDITFGSNGTSFLWFMNNSSFRGDYNDPVLLETKAGNLTFKKEWNVIDVGTNSSIRVILRNHGRFGAHPMHLHGHNFNVLAEGFGDWDGTVVNADNSQRRDVQILQNAPDPDMPSFIVLQWDNDNPGSWPLHCHLAWHVSGGLFVQMLERKEDIQAQTFDDDVVQTCRDWAAWTGT